MSDAGFSPIEVVDLLAFHAVAAQDHVDETIPVRLNIFSQTFGSLMLVHDLGNPIQLYPQLF